MSIRTFITFSSLLLLAWLALAFVHRPLAKGGSAPLAAGSPLAPQDLPDEVEQVAVSVSP